MAAKVIGVDAERDGVAQPVRSSLGDLDQRMALDGLVVEALPTIEERKARVGCSALNGGGA